MSHSFSHTEFYKELEFSLYKSSMEQRKAWVNTIIEKDMDLKYLSKLLMGEQKIATRFLWLLSEIGLSNPTQLFRELPYLFNLCDGLNPVYKTSFANYWLIAGIPPEQESAAINLCFHWLLSADTNITIKSRAIWVLQKLIKKYPDLKNELKLCLEDLSDKYSKDFQKRVNKIVAELEQ